MKLITSEEDIAAHQGATKDKDLCIIETGSRFARFEVYLLGEFGSRIFLCSFNNKYYAKDFAEEAIKNQRFSCEICGTKSTYSLVCHDIEDYHEFS